MVLACNGDESPDSGTDSTASPGTRNPTVQVLVQDSDGVPVDNAWVMMGGWSADRWELTNENGQATVTLEDAGTREQYLLVGKEGWFSGGERLDFDEPQPDLWTLQLRPLPSEDNPDYHFQPGGDGSSPDTSECGHCHWTIGDDWAASSHAQAAKSPRVWDLFTGASSETLEAEDCEALGGWLTEGATPGDPQSPQEHCYVGAGVLPWLHATCGTEATPACDHPDQQDQLQHFGSCGDCHSPAFDSTAPGQINLAAAEGVAREGVTCDFCHKVAHVTAGTSPGLDGSITLLRPSDPTPLPNLEFEAITFGPYPDVIVPVMNGSLSPQFSESEWCSSCHEYAQPALHPDEGGLVDPERWPEGVPVFETWSEYSSSSLAGVLACQGCHMPGLDEESSTYNITEQGLEPSVDQGWARESGQVRHHTFDRNGLGDPQLTVVLNTDGDQVTATVTLANSSAAHAVPTGEPMKQLIIQVEATDADGTVVPATGGQVIPDVGGHVLLGILGTDLSVDGSDLTFQDAVLPDEPGLMVRFVRRPGDWIDYDGPGTNGFSGEDRTAEERGLPREDFLGERTVAGTAGDTATLDDPPPDLVEGDRVYLVREGDLAGAVGWLHGKVLLASDGTRGVPHYRAVDVASDNRIAAEGTNTSTHLFTGQDLTVTATLIRRQRAAGVADLYGWDRGDVEVASAEAR